MAISKQLKAKLIKKFNEILDRPWGFDKALLIMVLGHAGQKDKGGNPYARHPMRVAEKMRTESTRNIALVHDIAEDTDITLDDLKELGQPENEAIATDALTKREGEEYMYSIINRVCKSEEAIEVKDEDIRDNSALWRLKNRILGEKDFRRMQNYIDALAFFGSLRKRK